MLEILMPSGRWTLDEAKVGKPKSSRGLILAASAPPYIRS